MSIVGAALGLTFQTPVELNRPTPIGTCFRRRTVRESLLCLCGPREAADLRSGTSQCGQELALGVGVAPGVGLEPPAADRLKQGARSPCSRACSKAASSSPS